MEAKEKEANRIKRVNNKNILTNGTKSNQKKEYVSAKQKERELTIRLMCTITSS